MSDSLTHYGILGMKWGIRRYQNPDGSLTPEGAKRYGRKVNKQAERALSGSQGRSEYLATRTIPKGTIMYRVTTDNLPEQKGKSTYVTYLNFDREHYRGMIQPGSYERTYRLESELKIPSREEYQDVLKKVILSDRELIVESMKSLVDIMLPEGSTNRHYASDESIKELISGLIEKIPNEPIEESYFTISQSLGLASKAKSAIISELSERGYNAMVDEASVGGRKNFMKEGIDPLIVFDNSVLTEVKSKSISRVQTFTSGNKFKMMRKKTNRHPEAKWSAILDNLTGKDFVCQKN